MKHTLSVLLAACFFFSSASAQGLIGAQWRLARTIEIPGAIIEAVASPTSPLLAVAGRKNVTLCDSDTGNRLAILLDNALDKGDDVQSILFSPDGKTLAVGIKSQGAGRIVGRIVVFDVASKKEILAHQTGGAPLVMCFAPNGKYLAFSFISQKTSFISVVDLNANSVVRQMEGALYSATTLAWQENGKILVSAGGGSKIDGAFGELQCEIIRWNSNSGSMASRFYLSPGGPNCAISEDGTMLATMGGEIRLSTAQDRRQSVSWPGTSVSAFLLPTSDEQPKQVARIADSGFYNGPESNIHWSADGKLLALIYGDSRNGSLLIWDGYEEKAVGARIAIGGELKSGGPPLRGATF